MSDAAAGLELPADALVSHPDFARLGAALDAPQVALRARFNAACIDLILVGVFSQVAISAAGGPTAPRSVARLAWFLLLEFAYFFVMEMRSGQTVGKRIFKVHVTTVSGARPSARQIALRNALRPFDAFPLLYASGLISMIRTGPRRRQRMGDVAATTTVVLDAGGRALRTPRWLLPGLTVLTAGLSAFVVVAAAKSGAGIVRAGTGLAPGQAPVAGTWNAHRTTISSIGYGNLSQPDVRWAIARDCGVADGDGGCGFDLTFDGVRGPVRMPLRPERGLWLAVFPVQSFPCGERNGRIAYWLEEAAIAVRFIAGGRRAEGEAQTFSHSPQCGYGRSTDRWSAELAHQ